MEEYIYFFLLKAPLYSNHVNKQDKTVILFSHVDIVSCSGMMECGFFFFFYSLLWNGLCDRSALSSFKNNMHLIVSKTNSNPRVTMQSVN